VSDEDLDFTKMPSTAQAPSAEQMGTARQEATAGGRALQEEGFYVARARHADGSRVVPRNGSRHTILVIEDDRDLARLVGEVLATAGFLTRFAGNKGEINAEFNRPPLPDLVLLDVSLPDADGFAILERIRRNARISRIPVVMMTGKSQSLDIALGLALGADGYVTKPFRIARLVEAVNTVLGTHKAA
jgi:two-component system, OmpR family, response regulator